MKSEILQKDEPLLRQIAKDIPLKEIGSPRIKNLFKKMSAILEKEEDGVALAAPQIGESLRMFVISGRILWYMEHPDEKEKPKKYPKDLVFINPKIIKLSKESKWIEEGCLSVRYLYGKIKRSTKATIKAYNEDGVAFQRGASGLLAQIFQHETDHLDGKLFIDKAKDLEEIPPEALDKKK